jgi:hypothetical protein
VCDGTLLDVRDIWGCYRGKFLKKSIRVVTLEVEY